MVFQLRPFITLIFTSIIMRSSEGSAFGDTDTSDNMSSGEPTSGRRVTTRYGDLGGRSNIQIQLSRVVTTKVDSAVEHSSDGTEIDRKLGPEGV
jgi:hypothetical protein